MSDTSNRQPVAVTPKRGEAAWRAAKEEVASRNERAYKLAGSAGRRNTTNTRPGVGPRTRAKGRSSQSADRRVVGV